MKKFLAIFVWMIFVSPLSDGNCGGFEESSVLAIVNGEVITAGHLLAEAGTWQKMPSALPSAETADLDLFGLLDNLIDERLMIQEARRIGLDNSESFLEKVSALVKRESVQKLREEEIFEKASVSDAEIIAFLQRRHGSSLYSGTDVPDTLGTRIEEELRRKKEKTLSERFFSRIRRKANIWIDYAVIDTVDLETTYAGEKDMVARVNGQPIPVDDFIANLKQVASTTRISKSKAKRRRHKGVRVTQAMKDKTLDRLITFALIEQEALRRDYLMDTAFANRIEKKKEKLLVSTFKEQRIYPQAVPTARDLKRYYKADPGAFREGYEVWKSEMRFQDREAAEKVLVELKQGASFEALATQRSGGAAASEGEVWIKVDRFPQPVRAVLEDLDTGETSDVISHGKQFKIFKLLGKRGGTKLPYTKVVDQLKRIVGQKLSQRVLSESLSRLRAKADIKIRRDILKAMEIELSKQPEEPLSEQRSVE